MRKKVLALSRKSGRTFAGNLRDFFLKHAGVFPRPLSALFLTFARKIRITVRKEDDMHNWFECKIKYEKTLESGMVKKVTEPYLVDALTFTEAEARILEEIRPFMSGEFEVSDIKRARYSELFDDGQGDRWYKCKVQFITLDEKSGAEKKTATQMLVRAGDLREAVKNLDEGMRGTMADYEIAAVQETAIMDVFPFGEKAQGAAPEVAE